MDQHSNNFDDTAADAAASTPPLNPQQWEQIREWASLGIRPSIIADFVNVTVDRLMNSCGPEIIKAALECHKTVLKSLYAMAVSRKCPTATIFWVKNMCADFLRTPEKKESAKRPPGKNDPVTPENYKPIEFDVYCNDGEPNFDD